MQSAFDLIMPETPSNVDAAAGQGTRRGLRMDLTPTQEISLWDALASVPDHRRPEGKRYPVASLLLIALAAMLAGRRDQLGIVRWGRRQKRDTLSAIGIDRDRVPAPSVWCELFQALDVAALERALGGWVAGEAAVSRCRDLWQATALEVPRQRPPTRICWRRSAPVYKV
jgi:hypothetical protein